jgi:hypothetical protein
LLENARAESGSLACAWLCLLDDIQTLCKWHNTTLLDGWRLLKTCSNKLPEQKEKSTQMSTYNSHVNFMRQGLPIEIHVKNPLNIQL